MVNKKIVSDSHLYIGIDGGGTKCKLVMENAEGKRLASIKAGPANICLSVDTAIDSIRSAVKAALIEAGYYAQRHELMLHVGLGLAGTEIPQACEAFLTKIQHDFHVVKLESDAYVACLGAHAGRDGAIVIIGTGTVGYKMIAGHHARVSGWGFPHSNEGSGAMIGLELIRQTFFAYDNRCDWTPLLAAVYQSFDQQIDRLVTFANYASATEYAQLFPLFAEHLAHADSCALVIIKQAAASIDKIIKQLLSERADLPLCLFGGVSTFIKPYLSDASTRYLLDRQFDATEGALMMVKPERWYGN